MKWKKEVHETQREALVADLRASLAFWQHRTVALGIHPSKPHAKALVGIEDAIREALSALGEDMTPHPAPNPQAGKEVNLPVWGMPPKEGKQSDKLNMPLKAPEGVTERILCFSDIGWRKSLNSAQ